jgi:predicted  nucleic acid-binding Zn-ribbon protein
MAHSTIEDLREQLSAAQEEIARLNTRIAIQDEQLMAMYDQLNTLTARSTTAADQMQLRSTSLLNALAKAEANAPSCTSPN